METTDVMFQLHKHIILQADRFSKKKKHNYLQDIGNMFKIIFSLIKL